MCNVMELKMLTLFVWDVHCSCSFRKKHQGQYESRAKQILLKDKYWVDGVKMLVLLAWDGT